MFRNRLDPLSPELRELFAKEREYPPQPGQVRARAVLRARMSAFRADPQRRPLLRRPAWLLLAAAPIVVFAAFAFASLRGGRSLVPPSGVLPLATGVVHPPSAPQAPPVEAQKKSSTEGEPSPTQTADVPADATHAGAKRRSTATVDAEAVELRLLQRARAAVASGEFASALAIIADYERRFPTGLLREECEALRIKSLAGLGKTEQARRAAEGFRKHYPRSVLSRSVEEPAKPSE
jgi:hypothetical protein